MSFSTLIQFLKRAIKADKKVHFIWHGGEPLILGQYWFSKILFFQRSVSTSAHQIQNSIQTNGLLLDNDWLDFFASNNISIGLSLDGPETFHDKTRKNLAGTGTYEKVKQTVDLLNARNSTYGALIVLNHELLRYGAKNLLDWATSLGLHTISLLPVRPNNPRHDSGKMLTDDYVSDNEYANYLRDIYDARRARPDCEIQVRELDSIIECLFGGRPSVCVLAGGCAGEYFGVDPDGSIYHCDKYSEEPDYRIGHVKDENLASLKHHSVVRKLAQENLAVEAKCRENCKWFRFCNGGCPHDRFIRYYYLGAEAADGCCGWADCIEHIVNAELPIYPLLEKHNWL